MICDHCGQVMQRTYGVVLLRHLHRCDRCGALKSQGVRLFCAAGRPAAEARRAVRLDSGTSTRTKLRRTRHRRGVRLS